MNTNNLNRSTSISKVFKEKQKTFAKKTAGKSKTDNSMQVDDYNEFPDKDFEELPILIDLNSSTESASSASSASTCSSNSTNTSSSYSNTLQPYQFYFGEISSEPVIETNLEIVLPELEEISNSTLPDFTLFQDA